MLERVQQHWEHLGADVDRAHEMYHDDAVLEFPQSGERFEGVANFREWRRQYPESLVFRLHSKGVVLSGARCIAAASDTVAFDKLTDRDVVLAYLPLAWVGDHYLNYAQSLVAGFCMACPESPDTAQQDLREIGPTFYFAPPRVFENLLTRVDDPHGGCRLAQAANVPLFHRRRAPLWRKNPRRQPVPLGGTAALLARRDAGLWPAEKPARLLARSRRPIPRARRSGRNCFRFYRSLGLNLKQLYGQTEAFLYVTAQPDGEIHPDTVGPAAPNVDIRIADTGEVMFKSPGMFLGYFKDEEKTAEAMTPDGFVNTGDAGFFDKSRASENHRPRQGCRQA